MNRPIGRRLLWQQPAGTGCPLRWMPAYRHQHAIVVAPTIPQRAAPVFYSLFQTIDCRLDPPAVGDPPLFVDCNLPAWIGQRCELPHSPIGVPSSRDTCPRKACARPTRQHERGYGKTAAIIIGWAAAATASPTSPICCAFGGVEGFSRPSRGLLQLASYPDARCRIS